jgi:hypothetical protein
VGKHIISAVITATARSTASTLKEKEEITKRNESELFAENAKTVETVREKGNG